MTKRRTFAFAALLLLLCQPAGADRRRAVGPYVPPPNLTAVEWLRATAIPFATTEARSGTADLEPLRLIVGNARVVALGEATHGSREFFTMKHRVLEYLVEEMGFTIFAIEANLPEADVVDDYVLNGRGDPRAALRGMYFWTWDTAEVLDMIEWMREYNLRRGDRPPVRFRGFDPQYASWTVGRVAEYLQRVDPEAAQPFLAQLSCLRMSPMTYRNLSAATRDACAASTATAMQAFAAQREAYSARSNATEYEAYLRYVRVIQQSEALWSNRARRDDLMAENAEWLMNVAHPGEKAVLWAHNLHVAADEAFRMGSGLRRSFGNDVVIAGFAFDRGSFMAHGALQFGVYSTTPNPPGGWEPFFAEAGMPRFLLDLRNPRHSPAAAAYLAQRRAMWAIGSGWTPEAGTERWPARLSSAFDVLIYIESVTPSAVHGFNR